MTKIQSQISGSRPWSGSASNQMLFC